MPKFDLHLHTTYSKDSWLTVKSLIKRVQEGHLDGLAVTDHDTIKGALALKKVAPFKVIIGEEISTAEGQIIGYFLEKEIKPHLPLKETITQIKKQGGLVAIPHPFDRTRMGLIKREALKRIIHQVDLIEVYNSRILWPRAEEKAKQLADLMNIPQTAGSDAHSKFELGKSFVEIEDFQTAADFMKKIRSAKLIHNHTFFGFYALSGLAKVKNLAFN